MIYIIGPKGMIGRSLSDYFDRQEVETKGIGRSDDVPTFCAADTVINCASAGWNPGQENDWQGAVESNILLPMEIERKRNGANLIHFCSGFELIPAMMDSCYALTKRITSESLEGKAHLVYLYTIFGGDYEPPWRFIGSLLKAVSLGKRYMVTTPFSTRDFVHVSRLCNFVSGLITHKDYRSWQFGTGHARTLANVVGVLEGILGRSLPNIEMGYVNSNYFEYRATQPCIPHDNFVFDLKTEYARWERRAYTIE